MLPIQISAQIARDRQAEIAGAAPQQHHRLRPSRRTSSARAPFAVRLLGRQAAFTD